MAGWVIHVRDGGPCLPDTVPSIPSTSALEVARYGFWGANRKACWSPFAL